MTFMDDVCYWRVGVLHIVVYGVPLPKGPGAASSSTGRQVMTMGTLGEDVLG